MSRAVLDAYRFGDSFVVPYHGGWLVSASKNGIFRLMRKVAQERVK